MEQFISQMLKRRREEIGMSQDLLAERVDTDVRTIRRIENGEVKRSSYLEAICKELNIGFQKSNPDEIISHYKSYTSPNVQNGLDLAHLLYECGHLEYYSEEQLEFEDTIFIEQFIDKCFEVMHIIEHVEAEDRRAIISCLTKELEALNKEGLFIYGSCNDLLLNDFKVTELVFVKI